MKYYIIPKYRVAIQNKPYAQEALEQFLARQGDFELPTFLDNYPSVMPTHFKQFFADYTELTCLVPVHKHLPQPTTISRTTLRTPLEIAVSKIKPLSTVKEESYRLKKMLGKI